MGFLKWASQLRFRELFFLTLAVFVLDMVLIDPLPIIDEVFLGLLTLLLGAVKKRTGDRDRSPREIN